jgi:hypothetical protein
MPGAIGLRKCPSQGFHLCTPVPSIDFPQAVTSPHPLQKLPATQKAPVNPGLFFGDVMEDTAVMAAVAHKDGQFLP